MSCFLTAIKIKKLYICQVWRSRYQSKHLKKKKKLGIVNTCDVTHSSFERYDGEY